jgi:hypothetical protein
MQTGQNSIAPENPLPQLGQMRWDTVFMHLTALQPHSEPKATPRFIDWCEIGQHNAWHTVVRLHKQLVFLISSTSSSNHVSEQNSYCCYPAGGPC